MKDKVLIVIILLEILGVFSCFIFGMLICLKYDYINVLKVMLPLGCWVLAIVLMANSISDKYKEKHKKIQIVYLNEKETQDNEIHSKK